MIFGIWCYMIMLLEITMNINWINCMVLTVQWKAQFAKLYDKRFSWIDFVNTMADLQLPNCAIGIIKRVSAPWSDRAMLFSERNPGNSCLKISGQLFYHISNVFTQIKTIWLNLSKIYFVPDSKLYTACFCLHNAAIGIKQACSFHASFVDFQINVAVRLFS